MKARKQIAAAAAGLVLIWGAAYAGSDAPSNAPAQSRSDAATEVPPNVGGTGNDVIVLEITPTPGQPQPSEEEVAALQMLLLQLLMQQQEVPAETAPILAPSATMGVSI